MRTLWFQLESNGKAKQGIKFYLPIFTLLEKWCVAVHMLKLPGQLGNMQKSNLCASKYPRPSILRLMDKKTILDSWLYSNKFEKELKERTPLLQSVLLTASVHRRTSNTCTSDLYWISAVCMAATVCLKNRCPQMTAVQLLNTIFIQVWW